MPKCFFFAIAALFLFGIVLLLTGWFFIFLPLNPSANERLFKVEEGRGVFQIAEALEREGFISSKWFFILYIAGKGWYNDLKAGTYLLSPAMNIQEIGEIIRQGKIAAITITIPEGSTVGQIGELLRSKLNIQNATLQLQTKNVARYKNRFDFLKDAPDKALLEGYLFPDTYRFSYNDTVEEIVSSMLENFDAKLSPEIRAEISRQQKTIFQIVTMASMIEKEVASPKERRIVSGILWKRLEAGMPLQVDATIAYITGKQTTKISLEETKIDSPYNTYRYAGLPVGPISNPGLDSILAAVYPEKSTYWYYLSTPEGKIIFSRTLEEHNRAKEKYLR
jgi:UPF0755 protein